MASKDILLGMLIVAVVVLGYLLLTQSQIPSADEVPVYVPSTEQTPPAEEAPPTEQAPSEEPEQPPAEEPPATNETGDGPIIFTPINVSQEGDTTFVRVPPSSRTDTNTLVAINPTFIAVDPYDFLNDPFDFSNLIPTRSEGECKNQCDAYCLSQKNFCNQKCEAVHDDVCNDAIAQSLICKAACLQADLSLWDLVDCGEECEKQIAKACSVFTLAECKGKCGSIYLDRCIDECYDQC